VRALALLSAGLDSTVALALAAEQGTTIAAALTIDYGQRARQREIAYAARLADFFGVPHRVLELPFFAAATGGALLNAEDSLPAFDVGFLDEAERTERSARAVWVPNRNGVFLEVAAMLAEAEGLDGVLIGFNREEAETFPDNGADYLAAVNTALGFSTQARVRVCSPTLDLSKREIVRELRRLEIPAELLWPCYEGGEDWCRRCESCARFLRAKGGAD
jgi:7-cyano-7-deazaguanine synthase